MWKDYHAEGYEPLAIGLQQSLAILKQYARQYDFTVLNDANLTAWSMYSIGGYIPLNYVLDTAQVVVGRMEGFTEATIRGWIEPNLVGVSEQPQVQPFEFASVGANPAVGHGAVRFSLPNAANVSLRVYSCNGALVRTLVNGQMPAGSNTVNWNLLDNAGKPVANGLYVYELAAGSSVAHVKVSVMK
jgi:hypothetical protein